MKKLTGQFALVTGAARGIGRDIALQLADQGANVAVNYHQSAAAAESLAKEIEQRGCRALIVQADVAKRSGWQAIAEAVKQQWGGRLDVLINNAGITRDKTLRKMTDEDWDDVISTNLNACYYGVSTFMSGMVERKYGRIVNISSFVGQAGNFGQANYAASKGAIIAFTKTVALELARHNVTVNSLAPGFTETAMLAQVPEPVRQKILDRIPMGRFGKPEEIAKAVLFLVADGDYITGQQINVNGGVYM